MVFLLSFSNAIIDLTINKGCSNNDNSIFTKMLFLHSNPAELLEKRYGVTASVLHYKFIDFFGMVCVCVWWVCPFFATIKPLYLFSTCHSLANRRFSILVATAIPLQSGSQPSSQHTHMYRTLIIKCYLSFIDRPTSDWLLPNKKVAVVSDAKRVDVVLRPSIILFFVEPKMPVPFNAIFIRFSHNLSTFFSWHLCHPKQNM